MNEEQTIEVAGSEKRSTLKRKPRQVTVKIIKAKGGVVLVEWQEGGRPRRGYVPEMVIEQDKVSEEELEAAAPYGVVWENCIPGPGEVKEALAKTLRDSGVWTQQDLFAADPRAPFRQYAEQLYEQFIRKVKELGNG